MEESNNQFEEFEDISSSSPKSKARVIAENTLNTVRDTTVKAVDTYSNSAITHIDKYIKTIAFIVAIALALVFIAVGALILYLDKSMFIISLGIFVVGLVISLITLFLIYGIGHIITQNNEILKKL